MNHSVVKEYKKRSRSYDSEKIATFRNYINDLIMQKIDFSKTMIILEVACGTGAALRRVSKENIGGLSVGLDISKNMLKLAANKKSKNSPFLLVEGSSAELPFKDDAIDLIYCASAFHLFSHPLEALSEMLRVLKENGKLILEELARDKNLGVLLWDIVNRIFVPSHKKYYSVSELERLLSDSGFKKIDLLHLESSYFKHGKLFSAPMIFSATK